MWFGGKYVYSYLPFNEEDWGSDPSFDPPATSKKTLKGYIARNFGIMGIDDVPNGGLFFQHNIDGTQTVIRDADRLYDYEKDDKPVLSIGNL